MASGGKRSTSFKKGEPNPGKPKQKGAKSKTTLLKEKIGLTGWEQLCEYIQKDGAAKYAETLNELDGKDFVYAYNAFVQFVKPKLASVSMDATVKQETTIIDWTGKAIE